MFGAITLSLPFANMPQPFIAEAATKVVRNEKNMWGKDDISYDRKTTALTLCESAFERTIHWSEYIFQYLQPTQVEDR